jgi:hypothetical protein
MQYKLRLGTIEAQTLIYSRNVNAAAAVRPAAGGQPSAVILAQGENPSDWPFAPPGISFLWVRGKSDELLMKEVAVGHMR